MTPPLKRLQQDFQSYVLEDDHRMEPQIVGTESLSARERLQIYADAYRLRLLEALGTAFPGLHALVGDLELERLGRAYIGAYPSKHPSIRWFGRHLAEFLRRHQPYRSQPVLAEMAAFEWTQGEVFDAPDAPTVTLEQVAEVPPEAWGGMRLQPHPSLRHLQLEWNVATLWQEIDRGAEPPSPQRTQPALSWLLWRRERLTYWRSLEPDEVWALSAIGTGASFGDLCEGLNEWIDEDAVALHAATLLKRWVVDELISQLKRT